MLLSLPDWIFYLKWTIYAIELRAIEYQIENFLFHSLIVWPKYYWMPKNKLKQKLILAFYHLFLFWQTQVQENPAKVQSLSKWSKFMEQNQIFYVFIVVFLLRVFIFNLTSDIFLLLFHSLFRFIRM